MHVAERHILAIACRMRSLNADDFDVDEIYVDENGVVTWEFVRKDGSAKMFVRPIADSFQVEIVAADAAER